MHVKYDDDKVGLCRLNRIYCHNDWFKAGFVGTAKFKETAKDTTQYNVAAKAASVVLSYHTRKAMHTRMLSNACIARTKQFNTQ